MPEEGSQSQFIIDEVLSTLKETYPGHANMSDEERVEDVGGEQVIIRNEKLNNDVNTSLTQLFKADYPWRKKGATDEIMDNLYEQGIKKIIELHRKPGRENDFTEAIQAVLTREDEKDEDKKKRGTYTGPSIIRVVLEKHKKLLGLEE